MTNLYSIMHQTHQIKNSNFSDVFIKTNNKKKKFKKNYKFLKENKEQKLKDLIIKLRKLIINKII